MAMRMQSEKTFVARSEGSGSDKDSDEDDEAKGLSGKVDGAVTA
jgi:hypothetical protein